MPTFVYTAANNDGKIISGEMETTGKEIALSSLNRQELTIISINQKKESGSAMQSLTFSGLSAVDKLMLTKHLSIIIKAGLSIKEGIETLLNDARNKMLKKILTEAKFNLEKGQPLSTTFKAYPQYFSKVFIALLETGEISGTLERSLDYLGLQLDKEYKLKQKVKNAMIYPMILIFASVGVITIMMVLVIPKLTKIFFQNNLKLPWSTKLIMDISDFLTKNIVVLFIAFIASIMIFLSIRNKRSFQFAISKIIFKIPIAGELYKKIILARFTRTLGVLLASGISILKALDISSEVLGYNKYRNEFQKMKEEVSGGASMGAALRRRNDEFPYLLVNMVTIGEKTGKLDQVLSELATFYEDEVDSGLKSIISLVEPLLILVMGLVVGGIAFSVIIPIYQIVGTVG
ncbi:MAG: type II secretion system F family protein [Minisyncoccia bacterium]